MGNDLCRGEKRGRSSTSRQRKRQPLYAFNLDRAHAQRLTASTDSLWISDHRASGGYDNWLRSSESWHDVRSDYTASSKFDRKPYTTLDSFTSHRRVTQYGDVSTGGSTDRLLTSASADVRQDTEHVTGQQHSPATSPYYSMDQVRRRAYYHDDVTAVDQNRINHQREIARNIQLRQQQLQQQSGANLTNADYVPIKSILRKRSHDSPHAKTSDELSGAVTGSQQHYGRRIVASDVKQAGHGSKSRYGYLPAAASNRRFNNVNSVSFDGLAATDTDTATSPSQWTRHSDVTQPQHVASYAVTGVMSQYKRYDDGLSVQRHSLPDATASLDTLGDDDVFTGPSTGPPNSQSQPDLYGQVVEGTSHNYASLYSQSRHDLYEQPVEETSHNHTSLYSQSHPELYGQPVEVTSHKYTLYSQSQPDLSLGTTTTVSYVRRPDIDERPALTSTLKKPATVQSDVARTSRNPPDLVQGHYFAQTPASHTGTAGAATSSAKQQFVDERSDWSEARAVTANNRSPAQQRSPAAMHSPGGSVLVGAIQKKQYTCIYLYSQASAAAANDEPTP